MTTGFICSAFDLLHPGHLYILKECKKNCDYLIVGLHVNPQVERPLKNKPIETVYERWCRLSACKYVDKIIPYETEADLVNILTTEPLDVRFLGSDCQENITGESLVPLHYILRKNTFSSSELRKRLK
jgi:glycerol-3-phosphate cytidylyltransferase